RRMKDLVGVRIPGRRPRRGVGIEVLLVHAFEQQAPLDRSDIHLDAHLEQIFFENVRQGGQLGRIRDAQERKLERRAFAVDDLVDEAIAIGIAPASLREQGPRTSQIESQRSDGWIGAWRTRGKGTTRGYSKPNPDLVDHLLGVERMAERGAYAPIFEDRLFHVPGDVTIAGVGHLFALDLAVEERVVLGP